VSTARRALWRLALANTIASVIVALLARSSARSRSKGGARIRLLLLFTDVGAAMTTGDVLGREGRLADEPLFFYICRRRLASGVAPDSTTRCSPMWLKARLRLVSNYGYSSGYLAAAAVLVNV